VTKGSHSAVKCDRIMLVLMCKLWVYEKENITVFDVITSDRNGKMIAEVYTSNFFSYYNMLSLSAF
jgi:hypothetical protein